MASRVNTPDTYASPVAHAREILARARSEGLPKVSPPAASTARRITRLEYLVARDLEDAQAPYKTMGWVARGESMTARRRRADLVLHLRRTLPRPRGGWLREEHLRAAFDAWQREIDEARRLGLVQPFPEDLPVAKYVAAIG